MSSEDPRFGAAWRQWLDALATDASAAIAAAHLYQELDPAARDSWLDALVEDAPRLSAPSVAIYAPLLAVEDSPERRERMERAMGDELPATGEPRTLRGVTQSGERIAVLVLPLYLSFVGVLACRYHPDRGFTWVRHDPIQRDADAPWPGALLEGAQLEATPKKLVVEELAHAVLAQRRHGKELPAALQRFSDLFDVQLDA